MFLLDDLLMMPANGLMSIFREIQKVADQEIASEPENVRTELCDLYQLLETHQITEEEFDSRERVLLDQLDAVEARNAAGMGDEDEEEDEDEDEEDEDDDMDDEDDSESDEIEGSGVESHVLEIADAPIAFASKK